MNDGLFDLGQQPQTFPAQETVPIQDRQIEKIRKLFESAEIVDQGDRQRFVESIVDAPVASLRSLSRFQGLRVIEALSRRESGSTGPTGSAWDNREDDTWIDRL